MSARPAQGRRLGLAPYRGQRVQATAFYQRYGSRTARYSTQRARTACFIDVRAADGTHLAHHCWVEVPDTFQMQPGQHLRFTARVVAYDKGHGMGYDYTLTRLANIEEVPGMRVIDLETSEGKFACGPRDIGPHGTGLVGMGPVFRRELVRHRHTGDLYVLALLPGWSSNGIGDILGAEGPLAADADWRGIDLPTRQHDDPNLGWARVQPWSTVALAWDDGW